jgi:hypothetical protein
MNKKHLKDFYKIKSIILYNIFNIECQHVNVVYLFYLQKRTHFHHLIKKKNYYSNELLSCL